jgi:hypothetical protein
MEGYRPAPERSAGKTGKLAGGKGMFSCCVAKSRMNAAASKPERLAGLAISPAIQRDGMRRGHAGAAEREGAAAARPGGQNAGQMARRIGDGAGIRVAHGFAVGGRRVERLVAVAVLVGANDHQMSAVAIAIERAEALYG